MRKTLKFLKEEFLEMLPPTIFFFVVFHILFFIRSLIANEYGISVTSSIVATIGALIVGKAVLIADKLKLLKLFQKSNLVHRVIWKVFIYTIMVFIFRYLEEVIPLISKFGSFGSANQHLLEEIKWPKFWTIQIFLVVFLIIYVSFAELIKLVGKDKFKEMVFGKKV
ncbi:hypothetical protein [Formosa maritima]|uniref:Uncharacterized protein n=1 Tax=Formosa maritima TaxID=2592046 RepID=A0A5D0G3C7_9FLAO|nr:hypothetical protein [Formosa maritima]TYA53181.1 hypothetical protein FVF61_11045 [Formosa maritima]